MNLYTRIALAAGLVTSGITIMSANTGDTWAHFGMYLLGWVFEISGALSLGWNLGGIGDRKR